MEARGVQTRVGDESRRISKVNRAIERKQARREKLQIEIKAEQDMSEPSVLPELALSGESESKATQPAYTLSAEPFSAIDSQQSDELSVPTIDLDFVRSPGEIPGRYRDRKALESLPATEEPAAAAAQITTTTEAPSATAESVSAKIDKLLAQLEEIQRLTDDKGRQTQSKKKQTAAPLAGKKTESVEPQEQLRRHQKKRAKERDQGMEL